MDILMPHRISTRCVITGPRDEVERFRTTMIRVPQEADEETLDFNLITPMPEALKKSTPSGADADLGIEILTGQPRPGIFGMSRNSYLDLPGITTIEELRSWAEKERPDAIKAGEEAIAVQRETGFYDWYDWRIANWGTKWNSYHFQIDDDERDGVLSFHFDTAWSFPSPIFEKLARMFPVLRFECT
jgi:hypothetical protein